MLEEMKDIVDHLIKHHHKELSFMGKILMTINPHRKKDFDYETTALEKLEEEIVAEEEIVDEELIDSLRKLITDAVQQTDKEKAKVIFKEIKKMYEVLEDAEKRKIYPELNKASQTIKQLPKIFIELLVVITLGNWFNKSIVSFRSVAIFSLIFIKYPPGTTCIKSFLPTIDTSSRSREISSIEKLIVVSFLKVTFFPF